MKKIIIPTSVALASMIFLSGCVVAIGNRDPQDGGGTVGQQLIDLQKAKDVGAITDAEFKTQKARSLKNK
jgi:hypothetical protein